jgi:hypothetical protein
VIVAVLIDGMLAADLPCQVMFAVAAAEKTIYSKMRLAVIA